MHPVQGKPITTAFKKPGKAWSLGWHTGVDYAAATWYDIVAPASGYIARAGWDKSYGNFVVLRSTINGLPLNIYLCHMVKILVKPGQHVRIGQHIGEVGNTGNSYGSHCHLETRKSPYGFNGRDIIDPRIAYLHREVSFPSTPQLTVFDAVEWNIARERWYTPWDKRAAEIQRELRDEASVYAFQELFETKAINTVKRALPKCRNFSGPAGLEFFYDASSDRWTRMAADNKHSGIANRWGQKITLKRNQTGQLVDFFNFHAPIKAEGAGAKAAYGVWAADWVSKAKNPVVILGDLNASSESDPPKSNFQRLGFRSYKQQASITNESVKEFIPKKQDLCTIMTNPSGPADITGGEVDITTTAFESDHRRLEARIVIAP